MTLIVTGGLLRMPAGLPQGLHLLHQVNPKTYKVFRSQPGFPLPLCMPPRHTFASQSSKVPQSGLGLEGRGTGSETATEEGVAALNEGTGTMMGPAPRDPRRNGLDVPPMLRMYRSVDPVLFNLTRAPRLGQCPRLLWTAASPHLLKDYS